MNQASEFDTDDLDTFLIDNDPAKGVEGRYLR